MTSLSFSANKKPFLNFRQRGFSLLELMLSMALFSFALLGAMKMQIRAHEMLNDALLRSKALYLAGSHKEIRILSERAETIVLLQQAWQTRLNTDLPEVQVLLNENDNNVVVSFFWNSQHSYNHCSFEAKDCLRL